MFSLRNDSLEVQILDPVADRDRLGTRYCSGGYIFQIVDASVGELLTGPTFPDSFNVFDGQGIPDSFARVPLRDRVDPRIAIIPGTGRCDLLSDSILEPCTWDVTQQSAAGTESISFVTRQQLEPYSLSLERRVVLVDRTVRTTVHLENTGSVSFQVSWYPHPFFPHPAGDSLCRINATLNPPADSGYRLAPDGFLARRDWSPGSNHYLALDHEMRENAVVIQRHPKLGLISGHCSYVPRFFPVWGNENTFSWEPYFENSVAAGQSLDWGVDYTF